MTASQILALITVCSCRELRRIIRCFIWCDRGGFWKLHRRCPYRRLSDCNCTFLVKIYADFNDTCHSAVRSALQVPFQEDGDAHYKTHRAHSADCNCNGDHIFNAAYSLQSNAEYLHVSYPGIRHRQIVCHTVYDLFKALTSRLKLQILQCSAGQPQCALARVWRWFAGDRNTAYKFD